MRGKSSWMRMLALLGGFVFLYAPIALLVLYSFNASRLVTVWGGFSTRWYAELFDNAQLLASVSVSLRVALTAAALATVLGTFAALALSRGRAFPGRGPMLLAVFAPLVLPEVILGLSLLLLFVALDIGRGFWTIVISHATFGMCFVTIVVWARLSDMDRSLEEAAVDLGATPAGAFAQITLPLAAPAILAGFMLAFTLSLDDFVIASFTSGPGSTTLPMRIYSQIRLGLSPQINAISTLFLAVVFTALLAAHLAMRKQR
ncbi:MAG: ABC transporter permease [Beijerinckiaceae bacterium]